ncbi:MAG: porin [Xanthobacteraceae bacterium]|nr:porin [Xanthobacteraceae bacterium]
MKKLIVVAALLGAGGVAHADEVADLRAEAKALQKQNELLNKRLGDIEKRQRLLDARAADPSVVPAKAPPAPVDDSLTWHGVTLYGAVDVGFGYQAHGTPYNGSFPQGDNYIVAKASNRALFLATPNGLTTSFIGLKGTTEILPGINGIFKLETAFNPFSGNLANGPGSLVQNNGVPLAAQTSNGDSSRAGQAFNGQSYVGLSSPVLGTLTIGRQNGILYEDILAYDPLNGSYAFSILSSGTFNGGGDTENARLDQSIKYTWINGPFHASGQYQVGNYGNSGNSSWPHDAAQANAGISYAGLGIDGVYSKIRGAVAAATLGTTPAFLGNQTLAGTISDNTAFAVNGKYKTGPVELFAGYEHIDYANPENPVSAGFTDLGYVISTVSNTAFPNDKIVQMFWGGAKWQATDHLVVAGAYYHETQNSYGNGAGAKFTKGSGYSGVGPAGCSSNAFSQCSGSLDAGSLVLDYVFTKHFDVYTGVLYSKVNGGLGAGYLNSWNVAPTAGARYFF